MGYPAVRIHTPGLWQAKTLGQLAIFLAGCALPALALALLWAKLPAGLLAASAPWLRWAVTGVGLLGAFVLSHFLWPERALVEKISFSLVGVSAGVMLMSYFQDVHAYPFKLSWSEGNRFYDYSLVFGKSLYLADTPPEMAYNEPGRYALWGVLFLFKGLPIWVHRLWNALLFTVPLLLAGLLLSGWAYRRLAGRWHFATWAFLFLIQGPIYPSLVISALLVLGSRGWRLGWKLVIVFLASFYAALSRWTWLAAPGVWAGLIHFLWEESEPGEERWGFLPARKKTVLEAALLGGAGLAGGLLARPGLFLAPQQATGFALKQPLLWYRLFPNATYSQGILLALALAAGPLALWLAWLAWQRLWRLSWLQAAAAALPTLAFAAVGTVASTKIGGGSNLHNLDMFLITLAILAGLAARAVAEKGLHLWSAAPGPAWRQAAWRGLLALAVLVPAWNALNAGSPVRLPPQAIVDQALETIQAEVDRAQAQGEVLFMDHRQLLTFGYIRNIRLVSEYEMKFMMDQSMAGDPARFQAFYADLARQRFKLIVIHPLSLQFQGRDHNFGEENDAWVTWVAQALLCSYKPKVTLKEVGVQLLEPKKNPGENCP